MTIASSTTNPVAIVSAISDRLLRLNPARYITAKVPTSDNGTDRLGINVAEGLRRKTKITNDDQDDGERQLEFDIRHRGADRRRAVGQDLDIDGRRQRRPELRQQTPECRRRPR